jgi:hypothetical protein
MVISCERTLGCGYYFKSCLGCRLHRECVFEQIQVFRCWSSGILMIGYLIIISVYFLRMLIITYLSAALLSACEQSRLRMRTTSPANKAHAQVSMQVSSRGFVLGVFVCDRAYSVLLNPNVHTQRKQNIKRRTPAGVAFPE